MNKFISGLNASGSAQPEIIMTKNTLKGICVSYSDKSEKMLTYKEAASVLDSGIYDYDPPCGVWLAGAILAGCRSGFHTLTEHEVIKVFGWLASVAYFLSLADDSGLTEINGADGAPHKVALYHGEAGNVAVYPLMLRILIHDAIEGAAIIEHGRKNGAIIAALTVSKMIEIKWRTFCLTPYGSDFFSDALEQIIKRIQETIVSGSGGTSTAKPFIH